VETPVAFVTAHDRSRLELLVNFGILTGREATQAEVDRLARTIAPTPDRLSITAERRHEYAEGTETVVNLVSVATEAEPDDIPRLLELCEAWAAECAADRHLEALDL
jgi:hypothetical protein